MVTKLKEVDAVIVGLGWTGGILAKELSAAGLKVVALERGGQRSTEADFQVPLAIQLPAGEQAKEIVARARGPTQGVRLAVLPGFGRGWVGRRARQALRPGAALASDAR